MNVTVGNDLMSRVTKQQIYLSVKLIALLNFMRPEKNKGQIYKLILMYLLRQTKIHVALIIKVNAWHFIYYSSAS